MTGKVTPKRLPSPRTMLGWDGTDFFALRVDDKGHLQIDTLGLIALIDALQSVGTDRLIVRGEDQVLSYRRPVVSRTQGLVSGANGILNSATPSNGYVWVITNVVAQDRTSPTTRHQYLEVAAVGTAVFHSEDAALAANDLSQWRGHIYLEHDDVVQASFKGSLANDTCRVELMGFEFTKE